MTSEAEITRKHTVIGAGHGGKAMAAHLALMGFSVTLYNRTPEHVEIIKKRGGIEQDGSEESGPHGFGKLAKATSDIGDAVKHADFKRERTLPGGAQLNTKEELYYYRIFREHFGEFEDLSWMVRTKGSPVE